MRGECLTLPAQIVPHPKKYTSGDSKESSDFFIELTGRTFSFGVVSAVPLLVSRIQLKNTRSLFVNFSISLELTGFKNFGGNEVDFIAKLCLNLFRINVRKSII